MTLTPFRLLVDVLTFVIIGLLLWMLDDARSERDLALLERDAVIRVANDNAERLARASANDTKHTQELSDALKANQDLRRSVDDRDQRLRVNAVCPAAVPASASAGGVADAGPAELAADARSDYFTLRDQLALSRQMILGLQDQVRLCQP